MRLIGTVNNIDFTLYLKELRNSDRLPEKLFMQHEWFRVLRPNTQVLATTSDFSVIYKINSQGLRDKEYNFEKPKDKIRILAFGDSFTFGEGVEYGDRFSDIIEESIPNIEVINFGVPGWGLDQMLIKFAEEGVKYCPDYVIVFINNAMMRRSSADIIKNNCVVPENLIPKDSENSVSTVYVKRDSAFLDKKRDFSTLDKSFLFSFIKYRLCLFTLKNKLREDDKKAWDVVAKRKKEDQHHREHDSIMQNSPSDANADPILTRTVLLIKEFNDICKLHAIKLIIINIADFPNNFDLLKNIGKNILYYDLTATLMDEAGKYRLHFVYDRHYNKKAHKFIGQKTTEILKGVIH